MFENCRKLNLKGGGKIFGFSSGKTPWRAIVRKGQKEVWIERWKANGDNRIFSFWVTMAEMVGGKGCLLKWKRGSLSTPSCHSYWMLFILCSSTDSHLWPTIKPNDARLHQNLQNWSQKKPLHPKNCHFYFLLPKQWSLNSLCQTACISNPRWHRQLLDVCFSSWCPSMCLKVSKSNMNNLRAF